MLEKIKNKDKRVKKHKEIMFFSLLFNIIRKNLKLIIRSKSSSLIVLLGPLIIIALVGAAYNTSNIYDIKIGAFSESYNELSESVLESLGGQQFSVVKFENKEDCINSLKIAEIHACVIIPGNLQIGSLDPLDFHVDQSRVNLVWIIIDAMSSKLESKSSEISLKLTSEIIGTLRNAGDQIKSKETTLDDLNAKNTFILSKITEVKNNINSIDPDLVGAVDLGKISQKLESTVSANNLSLITFEPVFSTISNVKNKTEHLGASLQNATSGAVTNLEEANTEISSNIEAVDELKLILSGLKTNIASATGTSAETVVEPLKTHVTPVVVEKTHLNFLFPTLIVLVVMLISLLLSSGLVIREKTSPAFFRNYITPASDTVFLLGHFLTNFFILFLQLAVIFLVASFFFKESLTPVILMSAFSLVFIVSVFILIGMLIGYLFKSEETAMLATISLASLFLFFSSTILPLETLPESLKSAAGLNPFVISESILKKIMLFKYGFDVVKEPIFILAGYGLLAIFLLYGAEKLSKLRVE